MTEIAALAPIPSGVGFLYFSGPPIHGRDAHGGRKAAMADDTKPGATQGDDTENTNADEQTGADDDIEKIDGLGDNGKKALKAERDARRAAEEASTAASKALKDAQKDMAALNKRLKSLEEADLSESQKIAKERDELAEKVKGLAVKARDANGREAVRTQAAKLGADAKRLDVIWKIVRSDLAYDDDDEPSNVTDVLTALKSDHPEEFKPIVGKGDAGAGGGTKPKNDANAQLRRAYHGVG